MKTPKHFEHIGTNIVTLVESGKPVADWLKPWLASSTQSFHRSVPRSLSTGKQHNGGNHLWLTINMIQQGWTNPWFGTKKQIMERGGSVKGKKPVIVYLWQVKDYDRKDEDGNVITDDKGNPLKKQGLTFKTFTVWNAVDCGIDESMLNKRLDRLQAKHEAKHGIVDIDKDPATATESTVMDYINNDPTLTFAWGGDKAYYSPPNDHIQMPYRRDFKGDSADVEYAKTLAHEAVHSTGHKSRLDRDLISSFGSRGYAREELVAEIGSAMITASHGEEFSEEQCVAYLRGWLKATKQEDGSIDHGVLPWAMGKAVKAAGLVTGYTQDGDKEEEAAALAAAE